MTLDLRLRTCLLALWLVWAGWSVRAAAPQWELAEGEFSASPNEVAECYFNVLQGARPIATVVFPPTSIACNVSQSLIGKRGRLVFIVEPE